jgi:hypothetical protein
MWHRKLGRDAEQDGEANEPSVVFEELRQSDRQPEGKASSESGPLKEPGSDPKADEPR